MCTSGDSRQAQGLCVAEGGEGLSADGVESREATPQRPGVLWDHEQGRGAVSGGPWLLVTFLEEKGS